MAGTLYNQEALIRAVVSNGSDKYYEFGVAFGMNQGQISRAVSAMPADESKLLAIITRKKAAVDDISLENALIQACRELSAPIWGDVQRDLLSQDAVNTVPEPPLSQEPLPQQQSEQLSGETSTSSTVQVQTSQKEPLQLTVAPAPVKSLRPTNGMPRKRRHRRILGLDTPPSKFPKRLNESLRGFLDKEDGIARRDWRQLIDKLGLGEEDKEIVRTKESKAETALILWQQQVGEQESTARALAKILEEMGRFDIINEIDRFLGRATTSVSEQTRQNFEAIIEAAKKGDNEILKTLIGNKTGAQVEEEFKGMPQSPLHAAVYYGHLPTVEHLLAEGFDIHRLNYEDKTPRDLADEEDIDMLELLDSKADEQIPASASGKQLPVARSALDEATLTGDITKMEELIKKGSLVNQGAAPGRSNTGTPLHTAAGKGDIGAVKLLIGYEADIFITNLEGFTAEDLARKHRHPRVSEYLRMQRENYERGRLFQKVLGEIITVYPSDVRQTPSEFQIKSLSLNETMQEISDILGVSVKGLKNKGTEAKITNMRDLVAAKDVSVCTEEDLEVAPFPSLERPDPDGGWRFSVSVQHFSTFWSKPHSTLEFGLDDDFSDVLRRSSHQLGLPVDGLYTSDKLSKIRQTSALAFKRRVIAAAANDSVARESGRFVDPKFFGPAQLKTFGSDGGSLFDYQNGILIEVPSGAISQGQRVKVTVQVAAPDKRMDLDREWGCVDLIGHPLLVQTEPQDYKFHKPVKLRIPHCGVNEPNGQSQNILVLTANVSVPSDSYSQLQFLRLPEDQLIEVRDMHVVIEVSAFSWFWVFTKSADRSRQCVMALYTPSDEDARKERDTIRVRMCVFPNLPLYSTTANEVMNGTDDSDDSTGRSTQFFLRGRKRFTVTSQDTMNVGIENKGSVPWKIRPATMIFAFDEVWNTIYTNATEVYDVDVCMRVSLASESRRNEEPITLDFSLSGQEESSGKCKLDLFMNLSGSDRSSQGLLPAADERKLTGLLDNISGEENDRGWYAFGACLGMTRNQLKGLKTKKELHPTRIILSKFADRNGKKQELNDALNHLGYETLT